MLDHGPRKWRRPGGSGALGSATGWVGVLPAGAELKAALPLAWKWLAGEIRARTRRASPVSLAAGRDGLRHPALLFARGAVALRSRSLPAALSGRLGHRARDRSRTASGSRRALALFLGFAAAACVPPRSSPRFWSDPKSPNHSRIGERRYPDAGRRAHLFAHVDRGPFLLLNCHSG